MFQKRLEGKGEVWVNEFLYPILQGYDSVAMDVDLEIGSTDQTFNMLVGRKLQRIYREKEKFVLTTPMLVGLDGRKMSKTFGNTINVSDPPNEMHGKLMSLRDDLISQYFELATSLPLAEIKKIEEELKVKKMNPREAKARLAREIITIFYGRKKALAAGKEFDRVFREKGLPSKILEVEITDKKLNVMELLFKTKLVLSKSEAKRLILQKGLRIDGKTEDDWRKEIEIKKGQVIQVGKRRFAKIV
jgi:tyrosyl-tRNA synthetase